MIRTQVYLDDNIYAQIQLRAKVLNQPAAVLVRQYLATGLKKNRKGKTASETFLGLAKIGKGVNKGPSDLATNLDDYLYGNKR